MTLNYTLTPEALRRGAALHYNHRLGKWHYVRLALSIMMLVAGGYVLTAEFSRYPFLGAAMIVFGLITCLRKLIFCRRVVRSFYKTLDEPPEISVTMDKAGIDIQSKQSNGRTDWAGLVDYRANEFGILFYPQEGIFYWIPAHAEVEGGDWDKVLECAQANVDRRV